MNESILLVNVGDDPNRPRPGRRWLQSRYQIHQRLCMAFDHPGPLHPRIRLLYRVVPAAQPYILVRANHPPDWYRAFQNAPFLLQALPDPPRPVQADFEPGARHYFSLVANATLRRKFEDCDTGKRVGVVGEDALRAWLRRKAQHAGFEPADFIAQNTGFVAAWKDTWELKPRKDAQSAADSGGEAPGKPPAGKRVAHHMRFSAARFDGILQVTDTDRFRQALQNGIGPAKAFGFGMLCIGNPAD